LASPVLRKKAKIFSIKKRKKTSNFKTKNKKLDQVQVQQKKFFQS
jgi:hypothetical protein